MSKRIAGCDPSLTGTALSIAVPSSAVVLHEWGSKDHGTRIEERQARYDGILDPLVAVIADVRPDIMVIEAHPQGAVMGKVFDRTELRGQLMLRCRPYVGEWVEAGVWQVKRFAEIRKGEDDLRAAVARKWGRVIKSHNQADAYAMMMIGCYLGGIVKPRCCLQDLLAELIEDEAPRPPKPLSKREQARRAQLGLLGCA